EDKSDTYKKFFKSHKCEKLRSADDEFPVFDTHSAANETFISLFNNGSRAVILRDSSINQFVGMLTITDLINVLFIFHENSNSIMKNHYKEYKFDSWKRELLNYNQPLVSIAPDYSLYDAIKTLIQNKIHQLPVIDPVTGNNVQCIITHKKILKFLSHYIQELEKPLFVKKKLDELRIGTYDNIQTVTENTTLLSVLKKFVYHQISAVPVVDDNGKLINIYSKTDVINLITNETCYNFDATLKTAIRHRNDGFEGVHHCKLDQTLFMIMQKFVITE
ncbi:hypothetical protein PV325_013103, partial [Microctonus aethiopoides]